MKIFVYSLRKYDEEVFFKKFAKQYGIEYGYTEEMPTIANTYLAEGYDAIDILTSPVDSDMLDEYKKLGIKCIATRTIGYEHIDYEYAKKIGIGVINITYSPDSVADYTVMMMLMGLRKIKYIRMRAGVHDFSLEGKLAGELKNCTVGVIGTGKIGSAVIRDLAGFGCRIIAYDPYENEAVKKFAEYTDIESLYRESDIITLHAPYFESNHHMIDCEAFDKMKQGVGIVNCARGALIDSDALIANVENGKVGFAALDVVEHEYGLYYFNRMGEPLNNPRLAILNSYHNVIVTPHMAFYTDEAVSNMVENSLIGLIEYFNTGKCVFTDAKE